MNDVTIIYAHPYEKSFNHAILERVKERLAEQQKTYTVLDLYADGFNPVFSAEELKHFSEGKALDPLIKEYQKALSEANMLIFIFPIWWNDLPAIVKGFFDKVMLTGFAYTSSGHGITGLLTHIKLGKVFTTSEEPNAYLTTDAGDAINNVLLKATFKDIGIEQGEWINFDRISQTTEEERKEFLTTLNV